MTSRDAAAILRRARALRLRARGLRFMSECHREKIRILRERIWARTAMTRLERACYKEEIAIMLSAVARLRNRVS